MPKRSKAVKAAGTHQFQLFLVYTCIAPSHHAADKPLRGSEIVFLAQRNSQTKQAAKIAEEAGADVTYITDIFSMEKDDVAVWRKSTQTKPVPAL